MYAHLPKAARICFLSLMSCFLLTYAGFAQDSSAPAVKLYSPYTRISVPPGKTINYSIKVINNSGVARNVNLSVHGLTRAWDYSLKSGGWDVSRISVLPKKQETVSLQVTVPLKINKGTYTFRVEAPGVAVLPLTVSVSKRGTYKTDFTTKQANLEGAANTSFTFNASLKNETADTQRYALNSEPPPGWTVDFKASYKQVASVSVNPNKTQSITIDVHPPDQAQAGTYKIPVLASTNNTSAGFDLEVVITGSYAMELTTPSGLLSTDITAGNDKQIVLVVKNTGSSPLKKINMSASAPAKWTVTFDPKKIDVLPPGKSARVDATIKSYKDAIAGDYATTLEAKTSATSSKADFRISVKTSVLWGWVGILVIIIALGCVYYLFRKYGRR